MIKEPDLSSRIFDPEGKFKGSIENKAQTVADYIDAINSILKNDGEKLQSYQARLLFSKGYNALSNILEKQWEREHAGVPPAAQEDFKIKITGIAAVDKNKKDISSSNTKFQSLENEITIPLGKDVCLRFEYDIPEKYSAMIKFYMDHQHFRKLFSSKLKKGRGEAFVVFNNSNNDNTIEVFQIRPVIEPHPYINEEEPLFLASKTHPKVHITFEGKEGKSDEDDRKAPKVSESLLRGWTEDFEAAKEKAKKEGKLLFVYFAGSDWCGWCDKIRDDIFSQKKFYRQLARRYVPVMLDRPNNKSILSDLARRNNPELHYRFNVRSVPCVLILDSEETELVRLNGYRKGGVREYLRNLEEETKDIKWPRPQK